MIIMNQKLEKIARKLDLSDQDIKDIQSASSKEKLFRRFVFPILVAILSILTFISGYSLGFQPPVNLPINQSYPFSAAVQPYVALRRKRWIVYGLLISVISLIAGLFAGFLASHPFPVAIPSNTTWYNVYKRSGFGNR